MLFLFVHRSFVSFTSLLLLSQNTTRLLRVSFLSSRCASRGYGVRAIFVRFLGMRQHGLPRRQTRRSLTPATFPMRAGQSIAFFTVRMAREEHYWVAEASDTHLSALLGVVMEPLPEQPLNRFHVITIVSYHNWRGPIYFTIIRPFHHLVVRQMALAGVRFPRTRK